MQFMELLEVKFKIKKLNLYTFSAQSVYKINGFKRQIHIHKHTQAFCSLFNITIVEDHKPVL